jgi:hypothetical protein
MPTVDTTPNILVRIWYWLDGRKTILASLFWLFYVDIWPIIWQQMLDLSVAPEPYTRILAAFGTILTLLGLGHKFTKAISQP